MSAFSDSAFSAAPMSASTEVSTAIDVAGVRGIGVIGNPSIAAAANVFPAGVNGTGVIGRPFLWFPIDPNQNPNWTDIINSP